MSDAYANQGKTSDALRSYKKAAREFKEDKNFTAQYLFLAAFYADRVANNKKEATELYKELVKEYPNTVQGTEALKYLAQLGVYSED